MTRFNVNLVLDGTKIGELEAILHEDHLKIGGVHVRSDNWIGYTQLGRCQLYGTNRPYTMEHLSEERIAEIREDGMRLSDFRIGLEFWMSGTRWRCTDIGTRLVIAIQLVYDDDPSWYNGPPYVIPQSAIEPHDFPACSLDRYGGNSYNFPDEVVELLKTSGNYGRPEWNLGAPEALKRMRILRDEGRAARLQLPPMTPAQIEAEAAYADKIYKELVLNPTPETKRKISEAIKLRRPSRSQSL